MNKIKDLIMKYGKTIIIILLIFIMSNLVTIFIDYVYNDEYRIQRSILFFLIGIFLYLIRPKSIIHNINVENMKKNHKIICICIAILTVIVVICPMSINDVWGRASGESLKERKNSTESFEYLKQYENFTESFLRGNIYFDQFEPSNELKKMENPYKTNLRDIREVDFKWDHAYYEEKYYMYFGIMPVIILFAPLKLLGINILSSQATQIFSAFSTIGIFLLFYIMAKKYAPKMTLATYIGISSAVTGISLWYAIKYPALYCTAITSGICFAIWGFYFNFKAFIIEDRKNKIIGNVLLGAICNSLIFGCRPTIGFINFAYIPMIWYFLNKSIEKTEGKKIENVKMWLKQVFTKQNIQVMIAFCIPYIIVAIILMMYNYVRFDNPFEFGQSYQLTSFDQHTYMTEKRFSIYKFINAVYEHFLKGQKLEEIFPYISHCGVLINFPILLIIFYNFDIFNIRKLQKNCLKGLAETLSAVVIIICILHVLWADVVATRYSLDFNFILGILLFLAICKIVNTSEKENIKKISFKITVFAIYTVIICFMLFFVPFEFSIVELDENIIPEITQFLMIK